MKKLLFISLLVSFGIAHADLTVVQDFGGTALSTYVNTSLLAQKASLQNAFIAQL